MKVTFKPGNNISYGQDFRFFRGIPSGIKFEATKVSENLWRLVAPGYGDKRDYGNGAIYVSSNCHGKNYK